MAATIAISNQKGGVAKTTTCLSLGACLAEMGKSVLLIDLDPQAHLTLSLGIEPEEVRRGVDDAILGNASLLSVSRESGIPGLDIVPAHQELAVLNKILYKRTGYEFRLKNALNAMGNGLYDLVLIDCPPAPNILTLNALTAANLLIIPMQCEYYAAHSLRQTINLVELVRKRTNSRLLYRVLVTMYDRRNRICGIIHDQMKRGLKRILFDVVIEVDTKLRESPTVGQPVTLYAPNTRGAEQYRALAKELMNDG
jgi:chromosome partitioning protein